MTAADCHANWPAPKSERMSETDVEDRKQSTKKIEKSIKDALNLPGCLTHPSYMVHYIYYLKEAKKGGYTPQG